MSSNKSTIVNPYAKVSRKRPRQEDVQQESDRKLDHRSSASATKPLLTNTTNDVSADASALIISASDKAGMDGIDRAKIDAIILRESGNSLFMQQQRRRDEKVNQRIQLLQLKSKGYTMEDETLITPTVELQIQSFQSQQPQRSTCVVVDMDMFYMACELLTKPELKHRPACVGRGMILTSNYTARKYGVRSAMPGFVGDKLVEELSQGKEKLIHVRSNFDLYKTKSKQVVQVLQEYDPHLKSYSLDEAYWDIGNYLVLFLQRRTQFETQEELHQSILRESCLVNQPEGTSNTHYMDYLETIPSMICQQAASDIVSHMRRKVELATSGLTCSAGIAPNHGLAKIASDKNKPNGQLFIPSHRVDDFIHPLPVRKIPGIGRVTEKILQQVCHVNTVLDLYNSRRLVAWLLPPASATFLLKASVGCFGSSNGADPSDPQDGEATDEGSDTQKGISRERTFAAERSWTQLILRLEDIAQLLAKDMAKKKVMAHTVTVKVKLHTFDVLSRSKSLRKGAYIQAAEELIPLARELLSQLKSENDKKQNIFSCRLLGIRCSSLLHEDSFANPQQKTMDKYFSKQSELEPMKEVKQETSEEMNLKQKGDVDTDERRSETNPMRSDMSTVVASANKESMERNTCPLCNSEVIGNNVIFNRHVDTCLNASTVRQIVKETLEQKPVKKNRQRLTDFW